MNFWETFRRVNVNVNKWWGFSRLVGENKKSNYYIQLPTFSVPTPVWLGSSYIVTEFRLLGLGASFTLPYHISPPSNVNFCLAVRMPVVNGTGLGVTRRKIWENVGERLYYPLYENEVLGPDCVFEIWSTYSNSQCSLDVPFNLFISQLIQPSNLEQCCSRVDGKINGLSQYCSLFNFGDGNKNYQIPIVFDTCFNDIPSGETFYRITEDDSIRCNENEDLRVYV